MNNDLPSELLPKVEGSPSLVSSLVPLTTVEITTQLHLPTMHRGQATAWWALRDHRFKALRCGRRWGKALALDTPIPTPTGWTTMGDLEIGDWVFDEAGTPCQVTFVTEVQHDRPCNRVVFSDGSEIIADDDHRWLTWDSRARKNASRNGRKVHKTANPRKPTNQSAQIRTTAEIWATLHSNARGDVNHSIPSCGPIECAEAELLINPYVLGVWLGDGTSRLSEITCADAPLLDELRKEGQAVHAGRDRINFRLDIIGQGNKPGPDTVLYRLRSLGVLSNKHIPPQYLRASIAQRLALLQGLMDTDGYCGANSQCEFVSKSERLANDTLELILSLGIRATMGVGRATVNGKDCGPKYRIKFMTDLPMFRLERKAARQRARKSEAGRNIEHRFIVDVTPIESVAVRCIQVDSPSHLYLAGRQFIPTHNTDFAKIWIGDGLARGMECGWFAPQHKTWSEAYTEMRSAFLPIIDGGSKGAAVMRTSTGGRLDFWTLENQMAGRSRRYQRIVVDEAAFGKDGDNTSDGSLMDLWEKSIKPTLFDFRGEALICSNSAGKKPDNFFYKICTDEQYDFKEFHAKTVDNDRLPKRMPGESPMDWKINRARYLAELRAKNDPLVYAQEYEAEFVDWAGKAFFDPAKWFLDNVDNGQPAVVTSCDAVFAVIDTAVKDGQEHDGTAAIYFALSNTSPTPLVILDWEIIQIEGAMLETWLPTVFQNLEAFAKTHGARNGSVGAWIEDKASGSILLQQARNRGWNANEIESTLTAAGKDERAISISSYHYRGLVKTTATAYNKTATYKRETRNHLLTQVTGFRVGDKDAYKRPDDLLDAYCYGVAIALGNSEGQ